jgi:hypothetical protein
MKTLRRVLIGLALVGLVAGAAEAGERRYGGGLRNSTTPYGYGYDYGYRHVPHVPPVAIIVPVPVDQYGYGYRYGHAVPRHGGLRTVDPRQSPYRTVTRPWEAASSELGRPSGP